MKNYSYFGLAILLILSTNFNGNAQSTADVSASEPYPIYSAAYKRYFYNGNKVIAVKQDGDDFFLESYNVNPPSFAKVNEYKKMDKHDANIGYFKTKDNKLYVVEQKQGKDASSFYAKPINFDDATFGKNIDLFSVNTEIKRSIGVDESGTSLLEAGKSNQGFKLILLNGYTRYAIAITSADGSKMAIHYKTQKDKNSKTISNWVVYDASLNKLWSAHIQLSADKSKTSPFNYHLANNGDIYFILGSIRDKGESDLVYINHETEEENRTKIESPYKVMSNMELFENNKGKIYMAGGYNSSSEIRDYTTAMGIFMTNVTGGEIGDYINYEIPSDVRNSYFKERDVKKGVKKNGTPIKNLIIQKIDFQDDGSYTIAAESRYIVTYYDAKTGHTHTNYVARSIIAMGVDSGGEMEWVKKIPKNQFNAAHIFGVGFYYTSTDEDSYFVFPDKEGNFKIGKDEEPDKTTRNRDNLVMYKVSKADGSITKSVLFNMGKYVKGGEKYKLGNFDFKRIVPLGKTKFATEFYIGHRKEIFVTAEME